MKKLILGILIGMSIQAGVSWSKSTFFERQEQKHKLKREISEVISRISFWKSRTKY